MRLLYILLLSLVMLVPLLVGGYLYYSRKKQLEQLQSVLSAPPVPLNDKQQPVDNTIERKYEGLEEEPVIVEREFANSDPDPEEEEYNFDLDAIPMFTPLSGR